MSVKARTAALPFSPTFRVGSHVHAGVSLHSHTQYSEESLEIIPQYVGRTWLLRQVLGTDIPFHNAYWTPPLTPRQAYRVEEKQIQRGFQLPAMVSLTDHDSIRAPQMLHLLPGFDHTPVSVEWTVPFGPTFFHFGIHNLPAAEAEQTMSAFRAYTKAPAKPDLIAILQDLNARKDILIVLNHPLWDEKIIGDSAHRSALTEVMCTAGSLIHALEVNGLRTAKENQEVLVAGKNWNLPVVAGGDRHGREPNAVVNLTSGCSFPEFVEEVRHAKRSEIVFMPQYRKPLFLRTVRMVIDALRPYPERVHARRTWRERVFYRPTETAEPIPLCNLWQTTPHWIRAVDAVNTIGESTLMRSAARIAFSALEGIAD